MGPGENSSHNPEPSKDPLLPGTGGAEKDSSPLHALTSPYGSHDARRVARLLHRPSQADLAEVRDILYTTTSRPALCFIGEALARGLTPCHVDLAIDLLRLKALPSTEEFLWTLVSCEHHAARLGLSPILAGSGMAPLREEIAKLCVDPARFFTKDDREQHGGTIQRLACYAIVVLRRTAAQEVAPILVRAATRCGIDPEMNRLALEALTNLEESIPNYRVVASSQVAAMVTVMGDLLRDPLNKMDLHAFIERWLKKLPANGHDGDGVVRQALHDLWQERRSGSLSQLPGYESVMMDLVSLVRHFDDPASQMIVEQACDHPDAGVSYLARLCVGGDTRRALAALLGATLHSTQPEARLSALRVFGYSVSDEMDACLLPLFHSAVSRAFQDVGPGEVPDTLRKMRLVAISVMERRLYTQPLDAVFTSGVLAQVMNRKASEVSLLATTLMSMSRHGRVMPFSFYDNPELLTPVGITIALLRLQSNAGDRSISEVADTIEDHFILDGPALFGFQLARAAN